MSDEPLKKCPKCKAKVRRLMGSGTGILFKGSGFYETDYKQKSSGGNGKKKRNSESPASCPAKGSCPKKDTCSSS